MMKKSMIYIVTAVLALGTVMTGCGQKNSTKMDEYRELALAQLQSGEYADAAISFQRALDQSHGRVGVEELDLCYYKALAQDKAGDLEAAIETYTGLITYDEKNWEAYYLRGNVNLEAGNGKEALEDYDMAISLNPREFELYAHIDEYLSAAGYEDKGEAYLDQALALQISTPEDYYGVGQIYYLKGDFSNAETCLIQASSDGCDDALLDLGQVYMDQGKVEDATAAFDSYAEMYHDDSYALFLLGKAAMQAQCYDNALDYISQAFEQSSEADRQEMQKTLIAAYEHTGNYGAAYDLAAAYLNMYPDDTQMQRELQFLETRTGEDVEAVPETENDKKDDKADADQQDADEETTDEETTGEAETDETAVDAAGDAAGNGQ